MRRPAWTEWALNVTSAAHGEDVATFAEAAEAVREAQAAAIEGRDGPDVREALQALRSSSTTLVGHANAQLRGVGRPEETPELVAKLSELATSASAIEQLRRAMLGSGDAGDSDIFAGLEPAPAGARRARPAPAAQKTPVKSKAKAPAKGAEPEAKVTAIEKRRRQRELDVAERQFQKSRRRLREVEAEAASAGDAVAAAERTLRVGSRPPREGAGPGGAGSRSDARRRGSPRRGGRRPRRRLTRSVLQDRLTTIDFDGQFGP